LIEQTRLFGTVFWCSEFKLENIYSGVNLCGKNLCGNFYLRELIFADRKKRKIRTRKNFVPHGNQRSFRNTKKHPKLVKISEENNVKVALSRIYPEAQEL